ncbi:UDP-N-acetylglucosamine 1-carboxyvinyltransferase [Candidatus Gottesmanbacteria bacterium]|nr:UDP-N-acetylglucosamine 1-carboxyvinyltransferase [Candidatus Gottesmanbacteria bacterium]
MQTLIIQGGIPLRGEIAVAGAKNVALKAFASAILTDDRVEILNVPLIADVYYMLDVLKSLGIETDIHDHSVQIQSFSLKNTTVPIDIGARLRTSSLVVGPLLARFGEARIPNPGGCRIGARPIDRHIHGLQKMGAKITYHPEDGFFYLQASKLHGAEIEFEKNTHTGTEALILAAVLAEGETVLKNAACEVEVDDLIRFLVSMGAQVKRIKEREIVIRGVSKLHGARFSLMPDRNEEVTFALAAVATGGDVIVRHSRRAHLGAFLKVFAQAGGSHEVIDDTTTRYVQKGPIQSTDIVTKPHPGFMTDWQAPWALYMTQAVGISTIHETVFESRFSYVSELRKMGAHIDFFDPPVQDPESYYNFNWSDRLEGYHQAIRIFGPTPLHDAVVEIDDLRAGATVLLAALVASGTSYIHGVEQIDRGYENIEERFQKLGARITRKEKEL